MHARCRFPIFMSSSRFECHPDVITKNALAAVVDGPNLGQGRRSKSRPRGRGYCAVLSALAEGKVSIPVSLSRWLEPFRVRALIASDIVHQAVAKSRPRPSLS